MSLLGLHDWHRGFGATFCAVSGQEAVDHYGDPLAEHGALGQSAGVLDLSFRSRLCLAGADSIRFLNGQVTNDIKRLEVGQGCYAAAVSAKGKLQSDLNVWRLSAELLLDFEPGLSEAVAKRFQDFIIADDVQVVDVAGSYGLVSVQGPRAEDVVRLSGLNAEIPGTPLHCVALTGGPLGECYLANLARTGTQGFDWFVPSQSVQSVLEALVSAARKVGGGLCGWRALEMARLEAGIPRFGVDMDESNLAPEAGIEGRAISYSKGCYIGQEVIARIRTYGQVTKSLRGLRLADDLPNLPAKGDRLLQEGRSVGYITSALASPTWKANLALGYVRREVKPGDNSLRLQTSRGESPVQILDLPFAKNFA